MTRISSTATFYNKRIFPTIWFGFIALASLVGLASMIAERRFAELPFLMCIPSVLCIFGYVLMCRLLFELVDEVWDCGDSLLVRNKGIERRFDLSEFLNPYYTGSMNPPRITLLLREPSLDFGREIAFTPPFRLFAFTAPPLMWELVERIEQARRASGSAN